MAKDKRLVWDLPLRAFHWLLAFSILASYLTARDGGFNAMMYHMWLGYWTAGLIIFRVIWGFVGPRHARFVNFVPSPKRLFLYLKGFFSGASGHSVGHNPAGSLMVLLMLVLVAVQVTTGMMATDDIYTYGPYNGAVSASTGREMTLLHGANFDWILIAVCLHVLAILYYRVFKKHKLVWPMIIGRKPAENVPEGEAIANSQLLKAVVVAVLAAAIVYAIVHFAPVPPPADYGF
jgi:cytochrome b